MDPAWNSAIDLVDIGFWLTGCMSPLWHLATVFAYLFAEVKTEVSTLSGIVQLKGVRSEMHQLYSHGVGWRGGNVMSSPLAIE